MREIRKWRLTLEENFTKQIQFYYQYPYRLCNIGLLNLYNKLSFFHYCTVQFFVVQFNLWFKVQGAKDTNNLYKLVYWKALKPPICYTIVTTHCP